MQPLVRETRQRHRAVLGRQSNPKLRLPSAGRSTFGADRVLGRCHNPDSRNCFSVLVEHLKTSFQIGVELSRGKLLRFEYEQGAVLHRHSPVSTGYNPPNSRVRHLEEEPTLLVALRYRNSGRQAETLEPKPTCLVVARHRCQLDANSRQWLISRAEYLPGNDRLGEDRAGDQKVKQAVPEMTSYPTNRCSHGGRIPMAIPARPRATRSQRGRARDLVRCLPQMMVSQET